MNTPTRRPFAELLESEVAPGLVLMAATVLAIAIANSPLGPEAVRLLSLHLSMKLGDAGLDKSLLHWINDGLMAVFFLLVGMEIKREALEGVLAQPAQVVLPLAGAAGGMALPAAIYAALNWGDAAALRGWAIPAATDIAFSLGVLALLGSRVPLGLRLFLLTLAIADDLGAIVIIAIFYTDTLSTLALALAGACIALLLALNLAGVRRLGPYIAAGVVLWVCVLQSGVHATLAGVVLAFFLPLKGEGGDQRPFIVLEHALKPWVAFVIMPVFAFANAGVSLAGLGAEALGNPIALGIALGLFVGKQAGIFGASWLAIRLGLARLPEGASWIGLYGIALCAGIGFTMSLFIGTLAFDEVEQMRPLRLGVLGGSLLSALAGWAVLRFCSSRSGVSVFGDHVAEKRGGAER